MILLDTNICIYIINTRTPEVLAHFCRYRLGEVGLSSVVAAKLAYGGVAKSGSQRNRQALEVSRTAEEIAPFGEPAVWAYGALRTEFERQGKPMMGVLDMMIAAHALSLNAVLVTNNTREFSRVDGLRLENWAQG